MVRFHFWLNHIHIYISHIFIHSAVGGYVGCFHVWAIVNGTAMNVVKGTQL